MTVFYAPIARCDACGETTTVATPERAQFTICGRCVVRAAATLYRHGALPVEVLPGSAPALMAAGAER